MLYVHGACVGHNRVSDLLELELQATLTGCWEANLGPQEEQQASTLNQGAISLAPDLYFYRKLFLSPKNPPGPWNTIQELQIYRLHWPV